MKKILAMTAVAALTAFSAANASANQGFSTSTTKNSAGETTTLSTTFRVNSTATPLLVTFTNQLNPELSTAQPAGTFTVKNAKVGSDYKLGTMTVTGADVAGFGGSSSTGHACIVGGVNISGQCNLNVVATDIDDNGTFYVKVDHIAGRPVAGDTTINIPVTEYHS